MRKVDSSEIELDIWKWTECSIAWKEEVHPGICPKIKADETDLSDSSLFVLLTQYNWRKIIWLQIINCHNIHNVIQYDVVCCYVMLCEESQWDEEHLLEQERLSSHSQS